MFPGSGAPLRCTTWRSSPPAPLGQLSLKRTPFGATSRQSDAFPLILHWRAPSVAPPRKEDSHMLRNATALVLLAACAVHADTNNPETVAERSQATARAVLDRAVTAIGGAEALRSIDVVRLQLQGENWP